MGDTGRVDMPKVACSDCGILGCNWTHNGPLCPPNKSGSFCNECYRIRTDYGKVSIPPLPIGETDYFHRGNGKYIQLVFSDCDDPTPRPQADSEGIAARIERELDVEVTFTKGSCTACEFFWDPALNENKVTDLFNKLRKEFPLVSISGQTTSSHPDAM